MTMLTEDEKNKLQSDFDYFLWENHGIVEGIDPVKWSDYSETEQEYTRLAETPSQDFLVTYNKTNHEIYKSYY